MVLFVVLIQKKTSVGLFVQAVGINANAARRTGLKVSSIIFMVYVFSGICAGIAGLMESSMIAAADPNNAGLNTEMDAIASSVIGGTLMSGGVAFLPGTLLGVLIQGVIQTFITFQGTLSAWWTRIIIALLLCLFIVIQAVVSRSRQRLNSEH